MRNVPLLEATMTQVRDHPELHRQDAVFINTDCGTAACYAGWACRLSGYEVVAHYPVASVLTPRFGEQPAVEVARIDLGLTPAESETLFDVRNTSRMLELMVKDLCNGERLHMNGHYWHLAEGVDDE